NLGIEAEYSLSKRFSVQTGLLYTTKNYKLRGQDYHPPKGYWTNYVKLEDVTGTCKMWDIPVNIRYNAMIKKSSRIFVTTGLSSYLMKKKHYTYNYYYNGIPTTRRRAYDSGDMYWFSVLNISAGFEKTLSGKFSVQLEPFFKQPLTGVGFGSISLSTAGLYISLRYHPSFTHAKQAFSVKL